jgi:hypothetical protein
MQVTLNASHTYSGWLDALKANAGDIPPQISPATVKPEAARQMKMRQTTYLAAVYFCLRLEMST